ncbi:STAS domain-containing protein [Pokkaliibacter sp. MBI-7]|uniref:STAS domain-containing protein n=1 Tax=Pokkaliibacter sp. MBI-7 TaxID=3040600 RepID=UPI002449AAFB|nr:STAS domain-containing protein [Pokkaliibacter sp. MBI-7]MDH2435419.1 STAS domain-containing protein [Pokkaliibacter sp. MBI-7]
MSDITPQDGRRELILDSALTIYTAADTKLQLVGALQGALELHLNLSQIEEFDCAGLQLLLAVSQEAQRQNISFSLEGATAAVTDVVQMMGLKEQLPFGGLH